LATSHIQEKFASIRKGLLEFLILRIVACDKVYVADIVQRLSTTAFATQEGTLYPLLSKMRREGTVDYDWKESDAGPPRKYYKLTPKGKSQLDELTAYWAHINETLDMLGRGFTCTK
jgi:PadR family transcriptional regulator PadR